jgi:ribonuclease P protein component
MIDTTHRFQGYGSLRFVYQRGQTIRGQYCSLRFIANSRRKTYRAAVVVSKKVSKSAVVRNRIRRRMYEAIRHAAPDINGAYDLVFVVYSDQLATLPSEAIVHAVVDKLQKAGVLYADKGIKRAGHDIVIPKESLE